MADVIGNLYLQGDNDMKILVFGPGCPSCEETARVVAAAVKDAGVPADVEKIADFKEMMAHGVMSTPAVAIDGKVLCTGRVPRRDEVKDWILKAAN